MAFIEIRDLCFTYPVEKNKALSDISISIDQGEFVVLCGASGSGKTTLLRHLKKETIPTGERYGNVLYEGTPLQELKEEKAVKEIGMVFQDPENQIVMDTVINELAFSLENLGVDSVIIKKRIAEMAAFFGLEDSLYKSIHELSGGQKQTMNLCSVLMLQPKVLLLDEPTSQLDPVAAHEFLKMVYELNQEFSITVIITEHRLEEVFPLADRVIFMEEGKVKYNESPKKVAYRIIKENDANAAPFLPSVTRLFHYLGFGKDEIVENSIPMTVREGKELYETNRVNILRNSDNINSKNVEEIEVDLNPDINMGTQKREIVLECKDINFRYKKENPLVLQNLSLSIYKGDYLAILGGNGSGKTTLLQILAGIHEPQLGDIRLSNKKMRTIKSDDRYKRIGYVAQNPLLHFTFDTVEEELQYSVDRAKRENSEKTMNELVLHFEIGDILKRHPYDCSGGQQQKIAIACALASNPEILLIDEPTKGLDAISKDQFSSLLSRLQESGLTIVMVTHDIEFAASHASRCAMLFDGSIAFSAEPTEFFSRNYFYTTVVNRVMRDYLPDMVTYKDVIKQCEIQRNY